MADHRIPLIAVAATGMLAAAGFGHPMSVRTGMVHWDDAALRITVDVAHHGHTRAARHAEAPVDRERMPGIVAASLLVVDEFGADARVEAARWTADNQAIEVLYNVDDASRVATLVFQPVESWPVAPRQIQLRSDSRRIIRLTGRGNYVVLPRSTGADAEIAENWAFLIPAMRLSKLAAGGGLTIRIDLPLRVLNAWPDLLACPMERVVTAQTLAQHQDGIRQWAWRNCRVTSPDGQGLDVAFNAIRLIGPDDREIDPHSESPCSVFSTRVRISGTVAKSGALEPMRVIWNGFTGAVMRMRAVYDVDGESRQIGLLNSTQNAVEFTRALPRTPRITSHEAGMP